MISFVFEKNPLSSVGDGWQGETQAWVWGCWGVFCSGSGEETAGQKVMVRGGQVWKLFKKLN